eukprot:scaffold62742_cov12-Tisochrysis_lutea.AAC.1
MMKRIWKRIQQENSTYDRLAHKGSTKQNQRAQRSVAWQKGINSNQKYQRGDAISILAILFLKYSVALPGKKESTATKQIHTGKGQY